MDYQSVIYDVPSNGEQYKILQSKNADLISVKTTTIII